MATSSLDDRLASNHGLVVRHKSILYPEKLLHSLKTVFGSVNSFSTFTMNASTDLLSVIFFTDGRVSADCLSDLKAASHGISSNVVSVGWIHEDNFSKSWTSKPYIKGRYVNVATKEIAAVEQRGYLIIFWKFVPIASQRMEVEAFVNSFTCTQMADLKEGGRLFLSFTTEGVAMAFLHSFEERFPYLTRCVSLADESDFNLASLSSPASPA